MRGFYLSDFKKVSSNKTHTVMEHPDGHQIHLSHAKMKPEHLSDLKSMPVDGYAKGGMVRLPGPQKEKQKIQEGFKGALGFAKGGSVGEELDQAAMGNVGPAAVPQDQRVQGLQDRVPSSQAGIMGASQAVPEGEPNNEPVLSNPAQDNAQIMPQAQSQMAQAPSADPFGTEQQLGTQQGALQGMEQGIQAEANAEGALGNETAKREQQLANEVQALTADTDKRIAKYTAQNDMLRQDVFEGKINPQQYMQNQSTASNLLTGIGLLLGGIGSFATGGRNLAADFIDKQIDNDIKSQQQNLDNKFSLYNYNLKAMGNDMDAAKMTKANLMSVAAAEIEKLAQKSKDPLAQARAQQKIAELTFKSAELIAQTTARNNVLQHADKGNIAPENAIKALSKTPAEAKAALDDLETLRGAESAVKQVNEFFKDAAKISTVGAMTPFSESKTKFASDRAAILNAIRSSMKGQGALSDQEVASSIEPLLPAATDRPAQLEAKQKAIINTLKTKVGGLGANIKAIGYDYKPKFTIHPLR